ncbi:hypothetical protein [Lysinibacillus sp. TE18511]
MKQFRLGVIVAFAQKTFVADALLLRRKNATGHGVLRLGYSISVCVRALIEKEPQLHSFSTFRGMKINT